MIIFIAVAAVLCLFGFIAYMLQLSVYIVEQYFKFIAAKEEDKERGQQNADIQGKNRNSDMFCVYNRHGSYSDGKCKFPD